VTYQVVLISALTVTALTLLLAAQVLVMRSLLIVRLKRRDQFLKLWEPLLFSALEGEGPSRLPRVKPADLFTFLSLWNHLQDSLLDDGADRLNDVAERLGLRATARRMLQRRSHRHRLMAIATLGHLRDRAVWTPLCAMAASPQVALSLTAARALVKIDPAAAIQHLMPAIVTRDDWPAARVASLLRTAGPDAVSRPLVQAALEAGSVDTPRLIGLLETAYQEDATPAIRSFLTRVEDTDTITAGLRVFADPR
jgi:hypothetical protein